MAGLSITRGVCMFFTPPAASISDESASLATVPTPASARARVPNCGEKPFLQQFDDYHFDDARFEREPKVTLFDRADGFLVRPPRVEDAKPAIIIELTPYEDDSDDGAEVPF